MSIDHDNPTFYTRLQIYLHVSGAAVVYRIDTAGDLNLDHHPHMISGRLSEQLSEQHVDIVRHQNVGDIH